MGNLLSLLNDKGPVPRVDFYVDFESAQPSPAEAEVYARIEAVLSKAAGIIEELKAYQGAGVAIREAISNAASQDHQDKAWTLVCPLVKQLRAYYDYAQDLEKALCDILSELCGADTSAIQHLEAKQAITKQLAHILDFTLMFDNLKMNNPQIQNDFSYYRRTLNRRKMEDVSQGVLSGPELPDDVANRMSLFYANPTPMLNTLATATAELVADNAKITLENTTESLSTMASVCRVLNENPEYKSRFRNEETISFTLRVMVGIIILYDHLHPIGAFAKKAAIDMKASIKVIRDHPKHSDGLLNALRYNTKHFNDEATPKATKMMMS